MTSTMIPGSGSTSLFTALKKEADLTSEESQQAKEVTEARLKIYETVRAEVVP